MCPCAPAPPTLAAAPRARARQLDINMRLVSKSERILAQRGGDHQRKRDARCIMLRARRGVESYVLHDARHLWRCDMRAALPAYVTP
jgi:hypothetical protein